MASNNPREIGTLIVVILKARNLPNKRHIGKQDPYCAVFLNGEKKRTKAIKRGGQHPEWDEEVRFTLYEDTDDDLTGQDVPPPLPPKNGKAPKRIQGGQNMGIACYADDIREPDLIGDANVDLTEVLTKGETDEWFTLSNKDKYCGEVYLELTFWSNEPPPEKKSAAKIAKNSKHYGGPGSFVPSTESPPSSRAPSMNGGSFAEHLRRESLPSSLRSSSSQVNLDLYSAPYEQTIRAKSNRVPSVDHVVNDFGELSVVDRVSRRTSYALQDGYDSRSTSSVDFPIASSTSTREYQGPEQNSWSDDGSGYDRDQLDASQGQRYHQTSVSSSHSFPPPSTYQAPYESIPPQPSTVGYQPPRRPRYSVPITSSGFSPVSSSSQSSGFALPSRMSEPVGLAPLPTRTPAPSVYQPRPPRTPAPSGFAPLSSRPSSFMPSTPSVNSMYQALPTESPQSSFASYSGYGLAPPASAPSGHHSATPLASGPPAPSHSAPPQPYQGHNPPTPPQYHTPPSAATPGPPQTHVPGSRTLPQPPQIFGQPPVPQHPPLPPQGYSQISTPVQSQFGQPPQAYGYPSSLPPSASYGIPHNHIHPPLPTPPGPPGPLHPGSYSPPEHGISAIPPTSSFPHVPPPPPLPVQSSPPSNSPSHLSTSQSSRSGSFPPPTPPSCAHGRSASGRPSLPLPQPPPGPPPREQPIYQPIPPPPAPPALPAHSQVPPPPSLPPSGSQGQNYPAYPGPPPRPPTMPSEAQWSQSAEPQQYGQDGYQIPAGRPGGWA